MMRMMCIALLLAGCASRPEVLQGVSQDGRLMAPMGIADWGEVTLTHDHDNRTHFNLNQPARNVDATEGMVMSISTAVSPNDALYFCGVDPTLEVILHVDDDAVYRGIITGVPQCT